MIQGRSVSERVINCAFTVSNTLGVGFHEKIYENALIVELKRSDISFRRQQSYKVDYKGEIVGMYTADIVVEDRLLIELKAVSGFSRVHEAQVMNYLKASGLKVGLFLNFGTSKLGIKRIVWNHNETEKI